MISGPANSQDELVNVLHVCLELIESGEETIESLLSRYPEIKDLLRKIWDWWDENGRTRERVGELIERLGMRNFLKAIGVKPTPQMIKAPRANPYVFF